ncbi:MAG: hypothetical protein AB2814_02300, partial [Candidatus Sedimenticola endophacoides]
PIMRLKSRYIMHLEHYPFQKPPTNFSDEAKKLLLNTRAVFDILKTTRNAMPRNGNFSGA